MKTILILRNIKEFGLPLKNMFAMFLASIFTAIFLTNQSAFGLATDFNAGRIIDDLVFYNSKTMTVSQIQTFLESKVTNCDTNHAGFTGSTGTVYSGPWICLRDYYENPDSAYDVNFNYIDTDGTTKTGSRTYYNNNAYHYDSLTAVYPKTDGSYDIDGDYTKGYLLRAVISNPGGTQPDGSISAAQIIYNASQLYGINPQVLIVLLQKEQSLITDTWPASWQYQSATGYGCPDYKPCSASYAGFSNQVHSAAWQFKQYQANPFNFGYIPGRNNNILWSPNSICGSSTVYIQNQATAGLYNYTPYRPNQAALYAGYGIGDSCSSYGNRNFYLYFTDWFGPTIIGSFPSPLYKGSSDSIYAIFGDTKYPLASFDIINAYGMIKYQVSIVPDTFLDTFTTGRMISGTIAKKQYDSSGTLYLFDDGKRYPVSINACKKDSEGNDITNSTWSIDCFNSDVVLTLPNQLIDNFTVQDISIPNVILYNSSAWKMENGKKRRITDPVFVEILGGWSKARWMKTVNASVSEGQILIPSGSLVKFIGNNTLYLKNDSNLLPVTSIEDYFAWNINKLKTYNINSDYNTPSPLSISNTLIPIVKDTSNKYFLLTSSGTRIRLDDNQTDWPTENAASNIDFLINTMPIESTNKIYRSSSGNIFVIENGKKRIIPTMEDFFEIGFKTDWITNLTKSAESIVAYDGLKLSKYRLFKVNGSDEIRYVISDYASVKVNSTNYPGLPYEKLIIVDDITGQKYPITGAYNP